MTRVISSNNHKYRKNPKIADTPKIAVIILKFEQCGSTIE